MKGVTVHACFFDKECRDYGAPNRFYFGVPWGVLIVGIGKDNWTQGWFPGIGYTQAFLPVVWHPR
jgi:hypothetical protein